MCEVAKLFGHLGTLENADGTSFHLFLAQKATECVEAEKEYYVNTQKVFLEWQVWNRYYICMQCWTHIFSQKSNGGLFNGIEDPLLLSNLQLEGLLFDKVYMLIWWCWWNQLIYASQLWIWMCTSLSYWNSFRIWRSSHWFCLILKCGCLKVSHRYALIVRSWITG